MSSEALLKTSTPDPQLDALIPEFKSFLRGDQINLRLPDRLSYGRDCSSKSILWVRQGRVKYPPQLLLWPENTGQVVKIIRLANCHRIPVVAFGGGSGVCGGTWALRGGITLDLKRMDKVLKVDSRKMRVQAQSGINGEILERFLAQRGLTLGHFPSSIYSATLGGYLACRSAGQFSTYYGKIEDMLENMEVVLANGDVLEVGRVNEDPQSLELKEIFLGSEGTMGIITQATLRIHPRPKQEVYFGFEFKNLESGWNAIRTMLQKGLTPALVRLYDPLDTLLASSYKEGKAKFALEGISKVLHPLKHATRDFSLKLALKNPALLRGLFSILSTRSLLILGFLGPESLVSKQRKEAEKICQSLKGKALGERPGQYWLKHRYSVSYKLSPLFDEGFFADTMEVATTWENLPHLYHSVRNVIGREALVLAHFSHAYPEGCSIYFTFVGYRETEAQSENLYDTIWEKALRACVNAGGTISHHHGVGILKASFMKEEWGPAFSWLCKLKKTLDPKGILNPGKMGFPE